MFFVIFLCVCGFVVVFFFFGGWGCQSSLGTVSGCYFLSTFAQTCVILCVQCHYSMCVIVYVNFNGIFITTGHDPSLSVHIWSSKGKYVISILHALRMRTIGGQKTFPSFPTIAKLFIYPLLWLYQKKNNPEKLTT
jgi:hypothetical protein